MYDLKGIEMRHNKEREKAVQLEGERRMVRQIKVSTTSRTKERRIRLSPNTAIQFYDVQDRLGYDRATNAIDWLMKEAKVAIDALGDVNQDDHQGYQMPATTTIFNPSETFLPTTYDQIQQNTNHEQTNSLDHNLSALMNPINRCPQEIDLFSTSKASVDFTWSPNYNRGEGYGFVNREPIQSSLAPPIAHTSNNGFYGCYFQQEIQVQEDEKDNLWS